ncbi:hypothetical protein H9Y13_11095 [Aeromonas veronii]|uniref:hypothetical protein n=1 Tax=Aeromonas TaxID=642 RepID=UPI0022EAF1AE|nr:MULTISPECIES: hypothetical protein [Aeromonas]KAJ8738680.1 hypothetical protein H9Y13_11095 [Aeromonas veronii]MDA3317140.1 hypothetical protein [Aeromonas sp. PI_26]
MSHRLALKTSAPFWLPLTLVASGIYLSLSQMVVAAESGSTLPVYGHQVTLEGTPTITAGDTDITVSALPAVKDADNDAHIGWSYVWEVDGAGTEQTTNNPTTIPAYTPSAGMEGKQLQLKVKGLTEARSFPSETAISTVAASNILTIPFSTTAIPAASSWLTGKAVLGTKNINGIPLTITGTAFDGPYPAEKFCRGYVTPPGLASGASATLSFDKPVTNVKVFVMSLDADERFTASINNGSAPVVSVFPGTSGWRVNEPGYSADKCGPPLKIGYGNVLRGDTLGSVSFYATIGSKDQYYTQLSINTTQVSGLYYYISYDHVSIKE